MSDREIDDQVKVWNRDQWPVGMIANGIFGLIWYAALGHNPETPGEKIGAVSLMVSGVVTGAIWAYRTHVAENALRERLKREQCATENGGKQ